MSEWFDQLAAEYHRLRRIRRCRVRDGVECRYCMADAMASADERRNRARLVPALSRAAAVPTPAEGDPHHDPE